MRRSKTAGAPRRRCGRSWMLIPRAPRPTRPWISWRNSSNPGKTMHRTDRFPRACFFMCAVLAAASTGCAMHADFVDLRNDLRDVVKAQEQDRERDEGIQNRIKSLEAKLEAKPSGRESKDIDSLRLRMQQLEDRFKELEGRLARRSETYPVAPAASDLPDGEPSRQSKPARLPSLPEPPPMMPGTPSISPTSAYNLAYNDYMEGRYAMSIEGFQRFLNDFPSTAKTADALYFLGESYYGTKDFTRAAQSFERVINEYPKGEKVAPALFKVGVTAVEGGDVLKARAFLKRVIEEYPTSPEAKLAKGKLAELR
ncbi:MAG: tol-pal system protein YbgF [Nitrospirae bacterium]|nr:MAG: tol-pal system protein YbgF [Nitrospirota bacterium]